MKIFSNYIQNNKRVQQNNQSFGSTDVISESQNKPQINEIPAAVPQYNVSVPMSYSHVEDIKLPNNLTAHSYKLANGQRVVIVPKKGSTVVKTYVNTGSLNEPDNVRGISHYIEHNLFNGSEALGEKDFFSEVNKMGAYTNASTSFSVTDYVIESNLLDDTDLENKIKLHAGMIQTPKFLNEKLAKEKKIVDSEINMCLSDDHSRAATITLKNLFNIKSTSPDLIAGSTDNIDALTREDVINYFNNNYYPANMVTVISGEVEPEQTMALVSKYFNSTRTPSGSRHYEEMVPIEKPVRYDMVSDKTQGAAKILMAFAGPENANSKDRAYLRMVNEVLFGLATAKIQKLEQKYSTGIFANMERLGTRPQDRRALFIETSVPESYVEPLLKDIYSVFDSASRKLPTEDEFMAAKNSIKKTTSVALQSSASLNYHLGMNFLDGNPYFTSQYNDLIDSMTYQDFVDTVKKYYDLNKVSLTVVHPVNTSEETINDNYNKAKSAPVSFTGAVKKTPLDLSKVSEYTVGNNFDLTLQNTDSDVVNYVMVYDVDKYPSQKPAVSDILSDMLQLCGTQTKTKDENDAIFDKNAIGAALVSNGRALSLFGDFPVDKLQLSLDMFKDKITSPALTQDLFEQSVRRCKDNYSTEEPSAAEPFYSAIYKNSPAFYTVKEKLNSIDSVTLDDVKELYKNIISNAQGRVIISGPFDKHPELKQQIFNNIASYQPVKPKDVSVPEVFEPISKNELYLTETKKNQAEIIEGFKFNINGNMKDHLCLLLMNNILGGSSSSRLFLDLREKRHLAYNVYSSFSGKNDIGLLKLAIKTTTNNLETGEKSFDNIKKSIDGFNENIDKIKTEKVTSDELENAKKTLKTELLSSLEMDSAQAVKLSNSVLTPYGLNYINQMYNMIDEITAEDILNTAKYVFKNKPVYSISGIKEALDANKDYLSNLVA